MSDKPKVARVGTGAMILRDGKVLLGKRHDDPEKADSELHGEGTWTMPGGKLDYQEDPKEGVCREILEETGLSVEHDDVNLISVTNEIAPDAHFVTLGFLVDKFQGEPQVLEPDEITKWEWFDLDNLPSPVFPPSQKVVNNYLANEIYKH